MTKNDRHLVRTLRGMVQRCHNANDKNFANYGGRGIKVCDEWRKDPSAFAAHIGPRPSSRHSVDRIDVNGNYEPGNVRWATPREQGRNTRFNRFITARGETRLLIEWAELTGLSAQLILERIKKGWTEEEAVTVAKDRERRFVRPGRRERPITALGKTMCMSDWAREMGVTPAFLHKRLARGWPVDVAVTAPAGTRLDRFQSGFDGPFEQELPQEPSDFDTTEAPHG